MKANTVNKKTSSITVRQLTLVAFAAVLNVVGGQIALLFHLPIYLDSIGTILTGALLGPWFGMLPSLIGGLVMGMTVDIYSLYFMPVGMILGFCSGIAGKMLGMPKFTLKGLPKLLLFSLIISVPSTIVSAGISAYLFNGITSSGSTVLVQLLANTTNLGLTASIILVQAGTDLLDRIISLALISFLPKNLLTDWLRGE